MWLSLLLCFLAINSGLLAVKEEDAPVSYNGYRLFKIQGKGSTKDQRFMLNNLSSNLKGKEGVLELEKTDYLIGPSQVAGFKELAKSLDLDLELIYEDFGKILSTEKGSPLRKGFTWDAYYDIDAIYDYLRNMNKKYGNMTQLINAGKSYEGRDLLGLRILTSVGGKKGKPAIIIESGIHAREWIVHATSTYFINELLTSPRPELIKMRDTFDWHIFPAVNPDGYHYTYITDRMWRKTRSLSKPSDCYGADANRNWDHNWNTAGASSDPCDYQIYAGSKPFSESETKGLSEYTAATENLLGYIGLHSAAQMMLLPYSDFVEHFDNYDDLVKIGKVSLEYGRKVNGEVYAGPGTAAEMLYSVAGGSMDWVREKLHTKLVFTYEMRGTGFHWPPERIPEQGKELTEMIRGALDEAGKLGYYRVVSN